MHTIDALSVHFSILVLQQKIIGHCLLVNSLNKYFLPRFIDSLLQQHTKCTQTKLYSQHSQ